MRREDVFLIMRTKLEQMYLEIDPICCYDREQTGNKCVEDHIIRGNEGLNGVSTSQEDRALQEDDAPHLALELPLLCLGNALSPLP